MAVADITNEEFESAQSLYVDNGEENLASVMAKVAAQIQKEYESLKGIITDASPAASENRQPEKKLEELATETSSVTFGAEVEFFMVREREEKSLTYKAAMKPSSGNYDRKLGLSEVLIDLMKDRAGFIRRIKNSSAFNTSSLAGLADDELYGIVYDNTRQKPRFVVEKGNYQIEYNMPVVSSSKNAFNTLSEKIQQAFDVLRCLGTDPEFDFIPVVHGTLPVKGNEHLNMKSAMVDTNRFRLMRDVIPGDRKIGFTYSYEVAWLPTRNIGYIGIPDDLQPFQSIASIKFDFKNQDAMIGAVMDAFQLHLKVPIEHYLDFFNAAIVLGGVLMAASTSSIFFNESLSAGGEIRNVLYMQTFKDNFWLEPMRRKDDRIPSAAERAIFNPHLASSFEDLFEHPTLYNPVVPILRKYDNGSKDLRERLYHYLMQQSFCRVFVNPVVYNYDFDSHKLDLGIELRMLGCGPTMADMKANMLLYYGAIFGMIARGEQCKMFKKAREYAAKTQLDKKRINFEQRLAKNFTDACDGKRDNLFWIKDDGTEERDYVQIMKELTSLARAGLTYLGIRKNEIDTNIGIIEERTSTGLTSDRLQLMYVSRRLAEMPEAVQNDITKHREYRQKVLDDLLQLLVEAGYQEKPFHVFMNQYL